MLHSIFRGPDTRHLHVCGGLPWLSQISKSVQLTGLGTSWVLGKSSILPGLSSIRARNGDHDMGTLLLKGQRESPE